MMDLLTFACLMVISVVSIHGLESKICARQSIKDQYAALFKIFPNRVQEKDGDFTNLFHTKKRRRFSKCGLLCKKPVVTREEEDLVTSLKMKIQPIVPITLTGKLDGLTASKSKLTLKSRKRRSVETNPDGSVTTFINCNDRGTIDIDGTKMLCKECYAQTVLPTDRYPRYINEVICDSNDNYCLTYQGACVQNYIYMTFKRDMGDHGLANLDQWTDYDQAVRNGCHCQLMTPSVFDPFV